MPHPLTEETEPKFVTLVCTIGMPLFSNSVLVTRMQIVIHADYVGMAFYSRFFMSECDSWTHV